MSKSLLNYAPLLLVAPFLFNGCHRNTANLPAPQATPSPQAALVVREVDSPAGVDSREPELFTATDGPVILSWVEKKDEKSYTLRFAVRDAAHGWSETRTAAEG